MVELIYLLNQGIHFTNDEGTQLFFSITKLLQSGDPLLRRAVYVYVKEMRQHPSIYIVTSSLLKDIHHKDPNFRRNSLRTIPLIVDASNLTQI
jgi:coatomer protein complex subunit gamma